MLRFHPVVASALVVATVVATTTLTASTANAASAIVMCLSSLGGKDTKAELTLTQAAADGLWYVTRKVTITADLGCRPISIAVSPGEFGIAKVETYGNGAGVHQIYRMPLARSGGLTGSAAYRDVFAHVQVGADETVDAGELRFHPGNGWTFLPIVGRMPASVPAISPAPGSRVVERIFVTQGISAGRRSVDDVEMDLIAREVAASRAPVEEKRRELEQWKRAFEERRHGRAENSRQ